MNLFKFVVVSGGGSGTRLISHVCFAQSGVVKDQIRSAGGSDAIKSDKGGQEIKVEVRIDWNRAMINFSFVCRVFHELWQSPWSTH